MLMYVYIYITYLHIHIIYYVIQYTYIYMYIFNIPPTPSAYGLEERVIVQQTVRCVTVASSRVGGQQWSSFCGTMWNGQFCIAIWHDAPQRFGVWVSTSHLLSSTFCKSSWAWQALGGPTWKLMQQAYAERPFGITPARDLESPGLLTTKYSYSHVCLVIYIYTYLFPACLVGKIQLFLMSLG